MTRLATPTSAEEVAFVALLNFGICRSDLVGKMSIMKSLKLHPQAGHAKARDKILDKVPG